MMVTSCKTSTRTVHLMPIPHIQKCSTCHTAVAYPSNTVKLSRNNRPSTRKHCDPVASSTSKTICYKTTKVDHQCTMRQCEDVSLSYMYELALACINSWNCCVLSCTFLTILIATSCPQYAPLYKSPNAPEAIFSWNAISLGSSSQSSTGGDARLRSDSICTP